MAQIEVLLPKMGESVAEATIIKWLKNEGDTIELDEPIIEIATDKVDSEVPSPNAGILIKRLCNEGDVVQVGKPIAIIGSAAEAAAPKVSPVQEIKVQSNGNGAVAPVVAYTSGNGNEVVSKNGPSGKFYSPLVRTIAQTEGVTIEELETINGTGMHGRVTKKDILSYLPNRGKTVAKPAVSVPSEQKPQEQKIAGKLVVFGQ